MILSQSSKYIGLHILHLRSFKKETVRLGIVAYAYNLIHWWGRNQEYLGSRAAQAKSLKKHILTNQAVSGGVYLLSWLLGSINRQFVVQDFPGINVSPYLKNN
jgi:hypothetical protein